MVDSLHLALFPLFLSNLQTLMTVQITLVKTVVLVRMASTILRVTALKGILEVFARQVCCFEGKIWFSH